MLNIDICMHFNLYDDTYLLIGKSACGSLGIFFQFQKIKDAIETHNTARCSIGPPRGIGDLKIEPAFAPKDTSAESTKE